VAAWEPSLRSRVAGRLVTGPVAFLLAGLVDWIVLLARYARARFRGRRPWD
jgi:hypothetical protein